MSDIDFSAAKEAIDKLNFAFESFKTANDARLKAVEQGRAPDPAIIAKIEKCEQDIAKQSAIVDAFAALESKVNKLKFAGVEDTKTLEAELKAFNMTRRIAASMEEYRAYTDAFRAYVHRGDESKAMSVGSDPDGGYTVTPAVSQMIVTRIYDTSPIDQIASAETIVSDRLEGLRDIDEASGGGWVAEQGARATTTSPQFGRWEIKVHEQYENPGVTQQLLDDASKVNIETWLAGKVADKMARRRNTAFVVGTGVGQPRGFASYTTAATADSSRSWGVLEHVASGTNGSFGTNPNGSDKLIDLVHKVKPHFRQNARFVMSRLTLAQVRQLKDAGGASANTGGYLWQPSIAAGQPSTLLAYPVTEAEDLVAYTTTDALAIAFGDFRAGYLIVNRIGIRTLRDPYTNKPYVQFYTTMRVGGDVVDFEAIKFLKMGTS